MASYDDTATVSGSVVSIDNGADEVGTKSCVVTVRPTLSGVSSVTETQAGRNLFDGTLSSSGASYIECYGNIHTPANVTTGLKVKAGVTYTISFAFPSALTNGIYGAYVSNKTLIVLKNNSSTANPTATFTAPQDDELCFWIYFSGGSTAPDVSLVTCQVEYGSTAHAYEPYQTPTQYTASLGRTIYGGTVDIVNGVGQAWGRVDLGSFNWVKVTSGQTPYFSTTTALSPSYKWASQNRNVLCGNEYSYASIGSTGSDEGFFVTDGSYVRIRDANYESMTAQEFKTAITGTVLVYELATPTDFTFDGQEINTRLGYNAFWSDSGDTELTYYKSGYGFTSVTVHKETPEGEPVEETRKLHRIIYEGQVDVIRGTGLIYIGESGTEYDPPETFTFPPISIGTDEGENTLFANEGDSAITYRKAVD